MRLRFMLLAAMMIALPAYAQTTITPPTRLTMETRFAQANVTNDGHLTLPQAKLKYKTVARNFAAIDQDKKGYVTLDDIRSYQKMRRALHRQSAATPRSTNS